MVHTRRMDSTTTTPEYGLRHRTRSSVQLGADLEGSNESGTESEEDHSWSSPDKTKSLPCVRELKRRYPSKRIRNRALKQRHTLSVYSTRKMHDTDSCNGNESEDDMYSSRARKSRHLRHARSTLSQIEKRTALSLRPLGSKCYADPHSPITYNTDDSAAEKDLRRSTRKRTIKYSEMSWLTDSQMPKVGYPSFRIAYSEEDSREAENEECLNTKSHKRMYETRRTTRLSNGVEDGKKSAKYLYTFKNTSAQNARSRQHRIDNEKAADEKQKVEKESNENKENNVTNGRLREGKVKVEPDEKEDSENDDVDEAKEEEQKIDEHKSMNDSTDRDCSEDEQDSSGSEEIRNVRKRRIINRIESPKRRNRKRSETSSSSEVNRVYSLRQRAPKPSNKPKIEQALSPRRRRFARRKASPDSSSSSSSDSEVARKSKYRSNNSKNLHSKNDHLIKSGAGSNKPLPIGPETIDNSVRFSSVGGLDSHVQCLKEMILLPMMYPEVFKQFQIEPPRGVLFHGPPGTGKTLIARALANECSFGSRKVSFFLRKGADLLSKWVGESERQLRMLFEQAQEIKPSIIFFDELDGLAPVRSSRQDQIHASIVSTLLALMDGLDNRGEVIVIGATNRIDAIDPALRRPGRFDRELFFPLPSQQERLEILNVHVSQWSDRPSQELLSYLAEQAVGYCGSDLRALCSEAVIQSFRRTYPQVYAADHRLLLDPKCVKVNKVDFLRAKSLLVPASHRISNTLGKKLLPVLEPILGESFKNALSFLKESFPHGLDPVLAKVKLSAGYRPAQLLLVGDGGQHGQTSYLAPAILHRMEHIHAYVLDLNMLYRESARSPEEACIQVFGEAKRNIPSVIYIPNIDQLWSLVHETVKAIFLSSLQHMDTNIPILLLATADVQFENLPEELQDVFSRYRKEVYQLNAPDENARTAFFKPLLIDACMKQVKPPRKRATTPPPLPRAPTPPPLPLTGDHARKLYEQEEHTLRELRIFLRDMCKKLANNKLFFMFTKPVDTEEVPDYTSIIKQPMDLETMMTKLDFHRYECAKDFLNDIELIVQNALEYNPAKTSADKQIRHRACSLRDYAHALIKNEMDTDFEDKCQKISKERVSRKASVSQYLPAYIITAENKGLRPVEADGEPQQVEECPPTTPVETPEKRSSPVMSGSVRKRKFQSCWRNGYLAKKRKRREKTSVANDSTEEQNDTLKEKDTSPMSTMDDSSITFGSQPDNRRSSVTTPLTVNCGNAKALESPTCRRVMNTSLLSPSELLDDHLDFDDIDKALYECVREENCTENLKIDVSKHALEDILEEVVELTVDKPLRSLLDLHSNLSRILRRYSRTTDRESLPKDLRVELERYRNELSYSELPPE
ncbi:ATPase family AAA domain-containing protein 2-like isoform X3 [Photinus pyralis]|uniref:Bromo domain-containing protein n=3 Tax=Photinus pyralis TaxID=7054 RepID=A0A1Y1K5T9_PHOPY|nr:ATPase family AAA domain-containing protein 2-like isoform X3 [Photinus pyralis]